MVVASVNKCDNKSDNCSTCYDNIVGQTYVMMIIIFCRSDYMLR